MAITTMADLDAALTSGIRRKRIIVSKTAALTPGTTNLYGSFWTIAGTSADGTPGSASACSNFSNGALPYSNPPSGTSQYIGRTIFTNNNTIGATYEFHDRLAHMGGLSGTSTSPQTVGIDLAALGSTSNISVRKGRADYTQVRWWIEGYTQTGTTATTAIFSCTDNTGATVSVSVTFPSSFAVTRLVPINLPTGVTGLSAINSVTLTATTGTVGSFGVTATVPKFEIVVPPNQLVVQEWSQTAMTKIEDSSCLAIIGISSTSSIPAPIGTITLVQG